MNLKQLKFVLSVAETSSFSRSAEVCHATQPTLSNAISHIEEELGGKLFSRTTRNVGLTAFGEYMLPYIRAILDDKNELEKAAHAYHNPEHKLLRIGLSPLVDMKLLVQVLEPFRNKYPKVNIFFKECLLDDLEGRLVDDQIDFSVIPENPDNTKHHTHFFYEEPLYYLPQEHGLETLDKREYRINELPDAPVILTGGGCGLNGSLKTIFKQESSELKSYPGQALSYKVIEEWASLGIGAGILPKAKISEDNKMTSPLLLSDGKQASFSYEWVWNADVSSRVEISDFIEYLTKMVPSLIRGGAVFAVA